MNGLKNSSVKWAAAAASAGAVLCILWMPLGLGAEQAAGVQHLLPDAMVFQPFPSEKGAQIAFLYGNPAATGHYIVRFKFAPNWDGRPHTHGGAELLTVRAGLCHVAHGEELTREAARPLPPGSFMALPAGVKMRGFTGPEGCVVDVQGQGPFTTQYLDEDAPPGR